MVNKSDFPRDNFDLLWMPAVCIPNSETSEQGGQLTPWSLGIPIPGRVGRLYPLYYYFPLPPDFKTFRRPWNLLLSTRDHKSAFHSQGTKG